MQVKKFVFVLLWLAATQGRECFESARVKKFRERNDEAYTVYVAQLDNTKDVKLFVCGKCPNTLEAGEFVCSELKDCTNISTECYHVYVTHFTNIKEDSWNVRITVEDSEKTSVEDSFVCKRPDSTISNRSDDYLVSVEHIAYERGFFVCQRRKLQDDQCVGNDFCNMLN